ncbi:hypothetical protein ACE193_16700 [Bernardetia sp. OM2101]|uniref:hypothetical protein n=1 Tax=Bernardetia sp. OM2101 TaxID=3344876 RepID=UPI0035D03C46
MLIHNNYKISQDCINIRLQTPPIKNVSYSKVVSKTDRKIITDLLDKIEFDELRKSYSYYAIDDMVEYDFTVNYKGKSKSIHIYDVKVKPIFDLAAKINTLLPKEYAIGYDEAYLSLSKR